MTDEYLIRAACARVLQPVCALGWRVSFAYHPVTGSTLWAVHARYPPHTFTKVVFADQQLAVYERWFTSCAAWLTHLAQVPTE